MLTNSNVRYKIPSHVFSFQGLRKLKLDRYFFNPPLEFEGILSLEVLILKYKFLFYSCINLHNFNILAAKLQILSFVFCGDALWLLQLLNTLFLLYLPYYPYYAWYIFQNSHNIFLTSQRN
uniref:Uncharacterized protein n=1 Tax=Lactuca sativa TaxID=4236 RepID=A0A9R1XV99_LACSA|nr:hypothetical protein LSAT_V11C100032400 [Lactuca sativa]